MFDTSPVNQGGIRRSSARPELKNHERPADVQTYEYAFETPATVGVRTRSTSRCSDDRGASLVEILVAITLMGTVVAAVISSVFVSVKATAYERDHAKAQQWLQSAIGVIEAVPFSECDPSLINGASVQQDYQAAVDGGAQRPWLYEGVLTVAEPEVWDGEKFVPFDSQSVCYDELRLRQQRVHLVVDHPERSHGISGDDQS